MGQEMTVEKSALVSLAVILIFSASAWAGENHRVRMTRRSVDRVEKLDGRTVEARTAAGRPFQYKGNQLKAFLHENGVLVNRVWTYPKSHGDYGFVATHHKRAKRIAPGFSTSNSTIIVGAVERGLLRIIGYSGYNRRYQHRRRGEIGGLMREFRLFSRASAD